MRQTAIVGLAAAAAFAVTVPAKPAAAQGIFEFLFGGFMRPSPPPIRRSDDVYDSNRRRGGEIARRSAGPRTAYCVRLCDGQYFRVESRRNFSAAQQCNSFCPAAKTKIFAGGAIEYAAAADGQRYANLPNAFAYRERTVPGCTCNGTDKVGLARIPVGEDPTLRAGDIVVTNSGFTVYNGRDPQRQDAFTPLGSAKVSKSLRNQLADVKIAPQPPPKEATADPEPPALDRTSSLSTQRRRVSARAQ